MKRLVTTLGVAALAAGAFGIALTADHSRAEACGCFAPPDPSVPIVQAGERIAFELVDGKVRAHIQIQYNGPAEEFGWLLPLPSLPTLEVGTDELFLQLISATQPVYRLDAEYVGDCPFDPFRNGGGGGSPSPDSAGEDEGGGDSGQTYNPLVVRDTVGPYDYAILRADQKGPMLQWLDDNGFFVPAGTDGAVVPYIRDGAYFLALKLLKGNEVGDIQPVVVEYESDLPMIPIVLTGVAADPDMPVMAWVLGDSRAIPRNYYQTRINDADLDWFTFGANYVEVVTKAVDESEGRHSFVTEYAGPTTPMVDVLDYPGRFGELSELRGLSDAVQFVDYLNYHGYTTGANVPPFIPVYTSQMLGILQKHLPVPAKLLEELTATDEATGTVGPGPSFYYTNFNYFITTDRTARPDFYQDLDLEFDPIALSDELETRVVTPTLDAGEMFRDNQYMTRMFTTMSPDEMTRDPVFSFNPDLPDVANVHSGRVIYYCGLIDEDTPTTTPAVLVTEDGWELAYPDGTGVNPWAEVEWPESRLTQVVREEGDEETVIDNTDEILAAIEAQNSGGGCAAGGGSEPLAALGLGALLAMVALRRRRRGA